MRTARAALGRRSVDLSEKQLGKVVDAPSMRPDKLDQPGYCACCGSRLSLATPAGDTQERFVCDRCGTVRYENPNIVVGCIATWGEKVLWIQRGNNPRRGYWAIPTGFMELGETPEQAAVRELYEETKATVEPSSLSLFLLGSLPGISEVHLLYRAQLTSPHYECTEEAMDVALLDEQCAPWDECAYPDVLDLMRIFYREHVARAYGIYSAVYTPGDFQFGRVGKASLASDANV